MSVSTARHPTPEYTSSVSDMPPLLDNQAVQEHLQYQTDLEALGRETLDALDASVSPSLKQTSSYRWSGEGSHSRGDPDAWTMVKWVQFVLQSFGENPTGWLDTYAVLQEIVKAGRTNKVEELYSYRNPPAVVGFLRAYPHLMEFLLEAYPYLERHFGPEPDIVLELVAYPEETAYDELVAWIQSEDQVREGLEKLEEFEEEWFLDRLAEIGNEFNFNIEFR